MSEQWTHHSGSREEHGEVIRRMNRGKLYVVATPIGNLEDMTCGAIRVLEGGGFHRRRGYRQTGSCLNAYDIHTSLTSLHEHNEQRKSGSLIVRIEAGDDVAYRIRCGNAGISDPGYRPDPGRHHHDIPVVAGFPEFPQS